MTEIKPKLEFSVNNSEEKLPVIVVAAGNSTRMKGVNKQFASLLGIPVIIKTLLSFQLCDIISNIILVVRAEDIFELQMLTEKYGITKLSDIVCGGNTRQESVLKGLSRIGEAQEKVLIHDGARPIISEDIIRRVTKGLKSFSAVTCAVKVKDTVKKILPDGTVCETLLRDSLVAVQTPQGVITKDYKAAIQKIGDVSTFTDDTSIMEAAGYTVLTVEGSYKNIKITTPEDIIVAESYLGNDSKEEI